MSTLSKVCAKQFYLFPIPRRVILVVSKATDDTRYFYVKREESETGTTLCIGIYKYCIGIKVAN